MRNVSSEGTLHQNMFARSEESMRRAQPFIPNGRDTEIIQLVHEHRFMSLELLEALLAKAPDADKKYGFGLSGLRARCQKLREHRYLVRRFLHDEPTGRGHHARRGAVYSVGSASIDLLADHTGLDRPQLKASIEKNALTSFFIRHFLGIAKFRVCLELACRATEGKVRIGTWLQDGLKDHVDVNVDGRMERIPVVPDALFSLVVQKSGGKMALSHFALEFDMGTMSLNRIAQKACGYWHYITESLYRRRYTYARATVDQPYLRVVQEDWEDITLTNRGLITSKGIQTLQVLFVTRAAPQDLKSLDAGKVPARKRQRNMVEAVGRVGDIHPATSRFLICTEELDYDIDRPATLFGPIWQTIMNDAGRLSIVN